MLNEWNKNRNAFTNLWKVADILLAAELENEMEAMAEGGDCNEEDEVNVEFYTSIARMSQTYLTTTSGPLVS